MITLTPRAAEQVKRMQAGHEDPGMRLRVFVDRGGCSGLEYGMSFDAPKPGDHELSSEGVSFLIDAGSLDHLRGSVVDFDDGLQGKGFEIRNPNAKSTCGCGKSFN